MFAPSSVIILGTMRRETGRRVQLENVEEAKAVANVIRTCLGPQARLKMVLDAMGGIVLTSDGNAILRDITVQRPAAKTLLEVARTQDEEVGDGTTSVIILIGELMFAAEPFLVKQIHPSTLIRAYKRCMGDLLELMEKFCIPLDVTNRDKMLGVVKQAINTKFVREWGDLIAKLALDSVERIIVDEKGKREIDIKRYIRVEKVPGGSLGESECLDGVMICHDVVIATMKRRIENPRIVCLDCSIEYKKGESQTFIEISAEGHFTQILEMEEEHVKKMCREILSVKPDLVITEKGVSDSAIHHLMKAGVTVIRRVRRMDMLRINKACGAVTVNRTDELKEEHVGRRAGLFEVKTIGYSSYVFITKCEKPKACTVILRGPSKDLLQEAERNFQDATQVARNIFVDPRLVHGGGCIECNLKRELLQRSKALPIAIQDVYRAAACALTVIPRTLALNTGENVIHLITRLETRQNHYGETTMGINGMTGEIFDVDQAGLFDPFLVKQQIFKTAFETCILLLKIDDIVSGTKKKYPDGDKPNLTKPPPEGTGLTDEDPHDSRVPPSL